MDLFKQGMKGPTRPAPAVPGFGVHRYSPVTNWNDDPFGADVFEPTPLYTQKKNPPPRPPPPKVKSVQSETPAKPSHFIRKPTVLTTLLSRKSRMDGRTDGGRLTVTTPNVNPHHQNLLTDFNSEVDANKMFPKCEPKNIQTGALIDLSSPPSSPTFTTRSSSDGVSVDSFGSDATSSTNHHNAFNGGGNASQAESGFEDDFDLYLHSSKKFDTVEDFATLDPFSPQSLSIKPPISKKPMLNKDLFELSSGQSAASLLNGPTIIRAKPVRPKPPDSTAILKSTFGNVLPITPMNVNTTTPIQKVSNGFGDSFDTQAFSWEENSLEEDRESSPPMPRIPPPPPPEVIDDDLPPVSWPEDGEDVSDGETEEPYAVALFDYYTNHEEDLCFSINAKIQLIRRVNDDWLFGRLRSGTEGLFPSRYVDIKVPLPNETVPASPRIGAATALYDFESSQPGDLPFRVGDVISVMYSLNEEWYYGECNGKKGQFPINYVEMS